MPHEGHAPGRRIKLTNEDYDRFKSSIAGVEKITSRFYPGEATLVTYGSKSAPFDIRAVHPDHQVLENTRMVAGRFLDDLDLSEKRKVAVLGVEVVKILAGGRDLLHETVRIGGIPYQVIGIFEDDGGSDEQRKVYLPITTAQVAWNGGNRVDQLMFTVGAATPDQARRMTDEAVRILAQRYRFSPSDKRALRARNNLEAFEKISGILDGIGVFVWLIGLGTIVAGIVGVSNIMLISVRERTREIGIRKALGAPPRSIVSMILAEAILITGVSGYFGVVAGLGALELARSVIPPADYFRDPQVNLAVVLTATVVLVLAGALAGYFPARRAAAVSPVAALRNE
jgi:putative ABC transport system permease protein